MINGHNLPRLTKLILAAQTNKNMFAYYFNICSFYSESTTMKHNQLNKVHSTTQIILERCTYCSVSDNCVCHTCHYAIVDVDNTVVCVNCEHQLSNIIA